MDSSNPESSSNHAKNGPKAKGRHEEKRPARKSSNQLQKGIQDFLERLPSSIFSDNGLSLEIISSSLPKRYTVYQPLLLLSANAFSAPAPWGALYAVLNEDQRQDLYASMLKAFSGTSVTHMAINAPITLTDTQGHENRMRSPVGLIPLHGYFGHLRSGDGEEVQPMESDFENALWVRTLQNNGIIQVWAPLYTMFSRGNITEKARILGHGGLFEGLDELSLGGDSVEEISVVDMYAGIGYFVFSYLRRGVKRVWGFELNGWSVEGLRRGCMENGWGCKVVKVQNDGKLDESLPELVRNLKDTDRVVIFHGDNRFAADIINETKGIMEAQGAWSSIRHVNLGLLPSSRPAWDSACKMLDFQRGGWAHVHENVAIQDIDQMKEDIVFEMTRLRTQDQDRLKPAKLALAAECRHVEHVKTYAPGVMHCVFDIKIPSYDSCP
ncbi:hypothetical protein ASPWEDRAFT_50468 [Aspergillus wentii DTO 134E9]|uniref:tRNA wybutosine-synthesizing protein 2 n=1 Tax=Aspergillus wentii DTO 134E9 TaxID=1073089 RepID=A0A1L9RQP3_ASPWE|nr:uncharacterized protein ASPWEDRAFT_50468 [Aspergillus wentii DTO 134E9]KAI9928303.1 hypothetical protein MW887_002336 [Aspergillus wentii]OJJ37212.1 hypothetical protein ASPWEDRAFT_50468 [Aspergillus wentii DTO 134E9]